jgi:3-phenylpropionate/trans-cinnamate dioxygenase ferredoxin component
MEFVKVLDTAELPANQMVVLKLGKREVLLVNLEGTYYAMANPCPHMGNALSTGELQEGVITCPGHGARFDAKTGKALSDAWVAYMRVPVRNAKSFPVKVEGTEVLVGLP